MDQILKQLKIKAKILNTETNGVVSRYFLRFDAGEKVSKLEKNATEIALGMKSYGKPIIRTITEKGLVIVELITKPQETIYFKDLTEKLNNTQNELPIIVGQSVVGDDLILDLTKLPHLLIAGSTGSGKSVLLHSIINSLLLNDEQVDLVLIDPKMVEFSCYTGIKQLSTDIITEPREAMKTLDYLIEEMNERFWLLSKKKVNNIVEYNNKAYKKLNYLVIVVDEFGDLVLSLKKEFSKKLTILAAKGRAAGLHFVIATQRPTTSIVSGNIKANFPARICFRVPSMVDSRVVLDVGGGEKMGGSGDGLLLSSTHDLVRFKGAFLTTEEIAEMVENNKSGLMSWLKWK